jgi:ATP/ADP translocase/HEAT repeat protein
MSITITPPSALFRALTAALGVKPAEERRTALLSLYLFLASAIFILGRTVRDTLFLSRYPLDALPWMFVLYGGVSALVAVVYGRVADRLSRQASTGGTVAIGVITYLVTWGLVRARFSWIYPVFYVWSEVLANLLIVQFWTLANDLHDARAAKRLFPLIGSARVLGVIVVGTSTGAIVRLLGTPQLLFVLVAMMVGLAALSFALRREPRVEAPRARGPAPPVLGDRYVQMLALLILLTFTSLTVGDYQFKAIARGTFREDALAQFFSLFYAVTGVISFFFQVFVTPRILARFGVGWGMAVMPAVFGAASALLPVVPHLGVATAMKFADNGLQYTIHDTSLQSLYVPFPARVKARTRALLDVAIKPLAYGLGGLVLVLLARRLPVHHLSLVTSALVLLWLALIPATRRLYQATLQRTLSTRGATALEQEPVLDAAGRQALRAMLESPDPRRVLLALEHLAEDPEAAPAGYWRPLLAHEDVRVRVAALRGLPEGARLPEEVWRRVLSDPSPEARAAGARYVARLRGDEGIDALLPALADGALEVRVAAAAGLLRHGGVEGSLLGGTHLAALLADRAPAGRGEAARVLGELGAEAYRPLRRLLDDPDAGVRRAALKACAGAPDERLVPLLIKLLDDHAVRIRAGQALLAVGVPAVPALLARLDDDAAPREARLYIPRILRGIPDEATYVGLLAHADHRDSHLRLRVLAALARLREALGKGPAPLAQLKGFIQQEVAEEFRKLAAWERARERYSTPLLAEHLEFRTRRAVRRVLHILELRYDPRSLRLIRGRLDDPRLRANALEALDSLLDAALRPLVMLFVDDAPLHLRVEAAGDLVPAIPEPDALLREELTHANPFVALLALDALALARSPLARELAPAALVHPSPLLREGAIHAIVATDFPHLRDLITPLTSDPDPTVAHHAREALAADPDARPEDTMNTTLEKILFLRSSPLFGQVASEDLAPLARVATIEDFSPGQRLVTEDELGDRLYVLISGKVAVTRRGERLATLGPGEALGEMAILDAAPRSATVTAEEETSALCIGSEEFYEILHEQVEIAEGVIRLLTRRLREANAEKTR